MYAHQAPLDGAAIQTVLGILQDVDARQQAEEMALNYYHAALQNLEDTGLEPAAQSNLRALASSLLSREA